MIDFHEINKINKFKKQIRNDFLGKLGIHSIGIKSYKEKIINICIDKKNYLKDEEIIFNIKNKYNNKYYSFVITKQNKTFIGDK